VWPGIHSLLTLLAEGMTQMHQGMAAFRAVEAALDLPRDHTMLAEAYGGSRQVKAGLRLLAEALAATHQHGWGWWEPELYRVKGELLRRSSIAGSAGKIIRACATRR